MEQLAALPNKQKLNPSAEIVRTFLIYPPDWNPHNGALDCIGSHDK